MNRPFFLLPFFLCVGVVGLFGNNYAIVNIPPHLLKNAHTVVRLEQIDLEVKSPSQVLERHHQVVTVLNHKSQKDYFSLFYSKSFDKVKEVYCVIYDAAGNEVKRYREKDLINQAAISNSSFYTDRRMYFVKLDQFKPPFTIESYCEVQHKNGFQAYPHWYQTYNEAIEKVSIRCTLPTDMDTQYKAFNLDIERQITNVSDKSQTHIWEISNLSASEYEPMSPPHFEVLPNLLITPTIFEVDGFVGQYDTWSSFGKFVGDVNADRDVLSPAMVKKVKELTQDLDTDTEKIQTLYRYLQQNTRYVNVSIGIGGWQTYDAQYVEQNGYGDCKALSNFMKSMLKAAGIESNLALVNSGKRTPINEDFPIPLFNHMILYIPSSDTWVECTSQSFPLNYYGAHIEDRNVLVLNEGGGQLAHISPIADNHASHQVAIRLDETGDAILQNTSQYKGKQHEKLRYFPLRYPTEKEQIEAFQAQSNFPTFTVSDLKTEASATAPEAMRQFEISISKYATKAGKRLFVPLNLISNFKTLLPETDTRKCPVVQDDGYTDEVACIIEIPNNYKVESVPSDIKLENDYGIYDFSMKTEGNSIHYKRRLTIHNVTVSPSDYESIQSFYKEIGKLDNAQVVLKEKET